MQKARYLKASPYADDELNLPVTNVDQAVPFYLQRMGFHLEASADSPVKSAVLARDDIRIGLAENGGDPSQEGCFFLVDSVEAAREELRSYGLNVQSELQTQTHGENTYRLFFVVAPDGLCYCIGEPADS